MRTDFFLVLNRKYFLKKISSSNTLVWKNIRVFQVDYLLSSKFFDGFLLYFLSLDGIEVIQSSGGPGWAVGDAVIISLDGHILQIF